jgi:hypothetical protein
VPSNQYYTPVSAVASTTGLGLDGDSIHGADGRDHLFGWSGFYEPKFTTLYDFYFKYPDGNSYIGTVADDGTYGYFVGETIKGSKGFYQIYNSSGVTTQSVGAVTDIYYHDVPSNHYYTPATPVASTTGLGLDGDSIHGIDQQDHLFGWSGFYEPVIGPAPPPPTSTANGSSGPNVALLSSYMASAFAGSSFNQSAPLLDPGTSGLQSASLASPTAGQRHG